MGRMLGDIIPSASERKGLRHITRLQAHVTQLDIKITFKLTTYLPLYSVKTSIALHEHYQTSN
jgi:hypothetical protein